MDTNTLSNSTSLVEPSKSTLLPAGTFTRHLYLQRMCWKAEHSDMLMVFAPARQAVLYFGERPVYIFLGGIWRYMTPQGEPDTPMEPNPMQYVLFAILHAYCTQHPDDARQNGFPVMEEHDV